MGPIQERCVTDSINPHVRTPQRLKLSPYVEEK